MKKSVKNVLLSFLVIIMVISIIVTINAFKLDGTNMKENTPPDMPQEMQNGERMQGENMEEPPEKPDGEQNDNNMEGNNLEEPKGMPQEKNDMNNNMEEMPDMQMGKMDNMNNMDNKEISFTCYIFLAIESLVLSLALIYLIQSKLNNKTFSETFKTSNEKLIYILAVLLLVIVLVFLEIYLCNNLSSKNIENQENKMEMGENKTSNITYSAKNEILVDEDITEGEFASSTEDENAIGVVGDINSNISNIYVNKTGDSSGGDNTSFYGINSAIIAREKANLTLKNIEVITDAVGANGVFCYGGSATTNNSSSDGTKIVISDSKITTTKDNSGGIMTTGGGEMEATNLEITTSGISSAAIRTDRGGGNVSVNGGTYTTLGQGSPAVYSTANITVESANLISKVSEGVVIEGKNSVSLTNTKLTDSNTKLNGKSTTYKNIFLYQSMSGDAAEGMSSFSAKNCEITTNNGDTFYVTNTTANITLENNTILNNDNNGYFLRAQKDSWGNTGSNGGKVTLNLKNQKALGNIFVDSISTLDIDMNNSSYYEGAINSENQAKSITLKLDSSSKIKLTADTYLTEFEDEDGSYSNIDFNGYTLYVNNKAIN